MTGNGHGSSRRNTLPWGCSWPLRAPGVTLKPEPCYTVAWWYGIVPNRNPKRLAASKNEGADPRDAGAA